jgi:hypothetical protein
MKDFNLSSWIIIAEIEKVNCESILNILGPHGTRRNDLD